MTTDWTGAAYRPFDLDVWDARLAHATFRTAWRPLSRATVETLVTEYRRRFNRGPALSAAQVLAAAEAHVVATALLAELHSSSGAFVRLGSRSPKDGAPVDVAALQRRIANAPSLDATEKTPEAATAHVVNAFARAYYREIAAGLHVDTGAEAVELLLRSERAYTDLFDALDAPTERPFNVNLFARSWDDSLDPELEFRGFIHAGHLTALSQYNHLIYLPRLQGVRVQRAISAGILAWWQQHVQPALAGDAAYQSYVADFGIALCEGGDDDEVTRVILIELNPFLPTTGAGLFSWEGDAALLRYGDGDGSGGDDAAQQPLPTLRVRDSEAPLLGLEPWMEATTRELFAVDAAPLERTLPLRVTFDPHRVSDPPPHAGVGFFAQRRGHGCELQ